MNTSGCAIHLFIHSLFIQIPQQSWTQGATGQKRPLGKAEAEAGSPRTVGAGEVSEEGYSGRGSG